MSENNKQVATTPVERLRAMTEKPSVMKQFEASLKGETGAFMASLIELFLSDQTLQKCDPAKVIVEAAKAASLRLPVNKGLGIAWILPYKNVPTFIIGYRGYIQLAMRTGLYKYINAGPVYEGELVGEDKLSGAIDLSGKKESDEVEGFFGYFKTLNGFEKTIYATKQDLLDHGKKYSPSFSSKYSPWQTKPDSMCRKTIIIELLSKWGLMSVEMANGITIDSDSANEQDYQENANADIIDVSPTETVDNSTGEIVDNQQEQEQGDAPPTQEELEKFEGSQEEEPAFAA